MLADLLELLLEAAVELFFKVVVPAIAWQISWKKFIALFAVGSGFLLWYLSRYGN